MSEGRMEGAGRRVIMGGEAGELGGGRLEGRR